MRRILVVGPSPKKSKGGMATVIKEIQEDSELNSNVNIEIYDSYIDGNKFKVLLYSVYSYVRFIISKKQYDIYHIHAASFGSIFRKGFYVRAVKRWNKKVILHIHGASFMDFYRGLSDIRKQQVVNILKAADMVVALSEDWKRKFDKFFGLQNCVVLENGINTEKLKTAIVTPGKNQDSFLMLGRLGKRKGTYDLVEAVERAKIIVPNVKLFLAGDGKVEKFKRIVKEKKLSNNIEIVGWVDFEKKLSLLKCVSTVVLPSYNEGLPMAILEGMGTGKVIISTTVGAIPEVVSAENGILIKPGDVDALSTAIIDCCTKTDMLNKMSVSNIEKVEESFSMRKMHAKLLDYYKVVYSR